MPNASNTPDTLDMMFHGFMKAHQELVSKMAMLNKVPLDPGAFLDEYQSAMGPTVTLALQVDRPALIEFIIVSYSPVGIATLTIGPASGNIRSIPIPAANTTIPIVIPAAMIVKPADVLTLTCSGATQTHLEVMGKVFSGTDWSQV